MDGCREGGWMEGAIDGCMYGRRDLSLLVLPESSESSNYPLLSKVSNRSLIHT